MTLQGLARRKTLKFIEERLISSILFGYIMRDGYYTTGSDLIFTVHFFFGVDFSLLIWENKIKDRYQACRWLIIFNYGIAQDACFFILAFLKNSVTIITTGSIAVKRRFGRRLRGRFIFHVQQLTLATSFYLFLYNSL